MRNSRESDLTSECHPHACKVNVSQSEGVAYRQGAADHADIRLAINSVHYILRKLSLRNSELNFVKNVAVPCRAAPHRGADAIRCRKTVSLQPVQ